MFRNISADDRGASALEFALILPMLLAMLAGIFEYGRVLLVEHAVRDVIDEAVRSGVVTDMSMAEVEAEVDSNLSTVPGIGDYEIDVTDDGTTLSITVDGSFDLVMGELLPDEVLTFTMSTQFPR